MEAGPGSTGLTREAGEERRGEEEPVQSHHTGTAGPGGQGCGKTTIQLKLFGTRNIPAHSSHKERGNFHRLSLLGVYCEVYCEPELMV